MTILGETPEGVANDTITIEVYPEVKPDMIDTWVAVIQSDPTMSIEQAETYLPKEMILYPNFPNPFNSQTTISFFLPEPCYTTLEVADAQGRSIIRLIEGDLRAGTHGTTWHGTSQAGHTVSSGRYYYILDTGRKQIIKKMVFIR